MDPSRPRLGHRYGTNPDHGGGALVSRTRLEPMSMVPALWHGGCARLPTYALTCGNVAERDAAIRRLGPGVLQSCGNSHLRITKI